MVADESLNLPGGHRVSVWTVGHSTRSFDEGLNWWELHQGTFNVDAYTLSKEAVVLYSMMLAQRPELVAASRPHRDDVPDTDPRNFHSPYRHEIHNFWKGINAWAGGGSWGQSDNEIRDAVVSQITYYTEANK